jgi:type VI protein secretion system component VasK
LLTSHTRQVAKGDSEMDVRLGKNLYWAATIIAGLIVVAVVTGYVSNVGEGEPFIPIVPLVLAGAIWLVGWACR